MCDASSTEPTGTPPDAPSDRADGGGRFADRHPTAATVVTASLSATVGLLLVTALLGGLLLLHRTGWVRVVSDGTYYTVLTAHGVGTLAWTSFAICGVYSWALVDDLETEVSARVLWLWFGLLVGGTVLVALVLVSDVLFGVEASVLYTFYAPLEAHPLFYVGLAMLFAGTWVAGAGWLRAYVRWRRTSGSERTPLRAFIVVVTVLFWYLSSVGVTIQVGLLVLPWSLGVAGQPDALLSRSLFWTMGQSLGYFWVLALYLVLYTVLPNAAGGRLVSDPLARAVCVAVLVVGPAFGFHHQYTDPGLAVVWKYAAFLKMLVLVAASLVTMFTVLASVEYGPRSRGVTGRLRWIRSLPWRTPAFASIALGGVALATGAVSGVLNANPHLNMRVTNTLWVVGHFHLMVAGGLALTVVGAVYWLLPRVTGRAVAWPGAASLLSFAWFGGVVVMAVAMHLAGLAGAPRRTAAPPHRMLDGGPLTNPETLHLPMVAGGVTLVAAAVGVAVVVVATVAASTVEADTSTPRTPLSGRDAAPALLSNLGVWTGVSAVLVAATYAVIVFQ